MEVVYSVEGLRGLPRPRRGPRAQIFLDRFMENAIEVDVDALCDGDDVWIGGIMQHVEEAGIHSGDSACVLPPHSLGGEALDADPRADARHRARARRRRADERPVRALRGRRLRDRGQPARVADGPVRVQGDRRPAGQDGLPRDARRADRRPRPARRSDAATTSASRRRCCRSTASTAPTGCSARRCARPARSWASAKDFPTAFAKAQAAAGVALPTTGTVFLTVTDVDKAAAVGIAAMLHDRGFDIVATARHGPRDRPHGHPGPAAQQDRRGLAQRRRLDRGRQGRPGHQHAHGLGRALGRLRDPPRGDRRRHRLHHHHQRRAWPRRGRSAASRRWSRCRSSTASARLPDRDAGPARPAARRGRRPPPAGRLLRPDRRRRGRPAPAAGAVLHAGRGGALGRGRGRAAVPAARVLRRPRRRRRPGVHARGRRAGDQPPRRAARRRRHLADGPARQAVRAGPRRAASRCWSAAASAPRRS